MDYRSIVESMDRIVVENELSEMIGGRDFEPMTEEEAGKFVQYLAGINIEHINEYHDDLRTVAVERSANWFNPNEKSKDLFAQAKNKRPDDMNPYEIMHLCKALSKMTEDQLVNLYRRCQADHSGLSVVVNNYYMTRTTPMAGVGIPHVMV